MLTIFENIFGHDIMCNEICYVYNDDYFPFPQIQYTSPLSIRLSVKSTDYWCMVIYQLSHELCHYALRQSNCKSNKEDCLKWFEETMCEALSLYVLDLFINTWNNCFLSTINKTYFNSIRQYLKNICKNEITNGLSKCKTLDELKLINDNSEDNRSDRRSERNRVYNLFKENPCEIFHIKDYQKYRENNGLLIDFNKWIEVEKDSKLIKEISKIQPKIFS